MEAEEDQEPELQGQVGAPRDRQSGLRGRQQPVQIHRHQHDRLRPLAGEAGTIFDNVLVAVGDGSTPVEEARKHADETSAKTKVAEKTMKDEIDEKEKKAAEEAEKKRKEEGAYISTGHSPPTHTRTHSVCSRSPSPIARSRRV